MKEKIYLKKSSRAGKSPSSSSSFFQFRNLFKFGIILLFWIAFIPLLWHQKTKNADDKTSTAKVVKEIPKSTPAASNVDSVGAQRESAPPVSPITEKPIGEQPGGKEEAPATTGGTPGQPRDLSGVRPEDQYKPPIGPVPETPPQAPASAKPAPTVARTPAGESPSERLPVHSAETSQQKPKSGGTVLPGEKAKPSSGLASTEKPKAPGASEKPKAPGAAAAPDKPKSAASSGVVPPATTPKSITPKELQAKPGTTVSAASTQKPTSPAMPADKTKPPTVTGSTPPTVTASKPPAPGAPPTTTKAPPTTPPTPTGEKAKEPSSGAVNWVYIVRLGTFQNPSQAQDLQKKMQQKGYAVAVKSHQNLQKGKVYYVELQGMRDAAAAKAQLDKLQREEKVNPELLKVAEGR